METNKGSYEDAELRAGVVARLTQLKRDGVDILAMIFTNEALNAVLTVNDLTEKKLKVTYTFEGNRFTWVIDKSEIGPVGSFYPR